MTNILYVEDDVSSQRLVDRILTAEGFAISIADNGIEAEILRWPLSKKRPGAIEYIADGEIDLVINIPKNNEPDELDNDYLFRRAAVDFDVPLITNRQLAERFAEALSSGAMSRLKAKSWREYV